MNTFWLKLAGIAVGVVVVIILIGTFSGGDKEPARPQEPEKGFSDMVKRDRETLSDVPQPVQQDAAAQQNTAAQDQSAQPAPGGNIPPQAVEEPLPEFRKLELEEDIEAQRLMEWVINQRSMGRLPVMGYGEMVRKCREIKQRWPGTKYAYQATKALADLLPKYHKMYNIKPEEIDLKNF
ncbi:MAG TPA: hypothetical protein VJJ98_03100 [Sedimentisphaerales bacterium]|nr:hypothetical protein [Sedimentisphaerales bacterium]